MTFFVELYSYNNNSLDAVLKVCHYKNINIIGDGEKELLYFMRSIYKLSEIEVLKKENIIEEELSQYLLEEFLNILKKIDTKIPLYEFDLKEYGKLVIFEARDNLSNLHDTEFEIETVKKVIMSVFDEKLYYTGEVLCKGDKIVHFVAPRGVYEKNIEYWFQSYLK